MRCSGTIERALRKLSCKNTTHKTEDEKSSYDFNVADKINSLMPLFFRNY